MEDEREYIQAGGRTYLSEDDVQALERVYGIKTELGLWQRVIAFFGYTKKERRKAVVLFEKEFQELWIQNLDIVKYGKELKTNPQIFTKSDKEKIKEELNALKLKINSISKIGLMIDRYLKNNKKSSLLEAINLEIAPDRMNVVIVQKLLGEN